METPARLCGSCTACCKTHPIRELHKRPNTWCVHCAIGKGCRIYADRPVGCRDFLCTWRCGLWGEEDRPDRLKVVVDVIEFKFSTHMLPVFMLWEVSPGALQKKHTKGIRLGILSGGHSILEIPCMGECVLQLQPAHVSPGTEYLLEDGRKPRIVYL